MPHCHNCWSYTLSMDSVQRMNSATELSGFSHCWQWKSVVFIPWMLLHWCCSSSSCGHSDSISSLTASTDTTILTATERRPHGPDMEVCHPAHVLDLAHQLIGFYTAAVEIKHTFCYWSLCSHFLSGDLGTYPVCRKHFFIKRPQFKQMALK